MHDPSFNVVVARWPGERDRVGAIREAVFVREQGVPLSLEWDGHDDTAVHFLAVDATGRPVGTARLLPGGQIGRMAVLPRRRGHGIGKALLAEAIGTARRSGIGQVFVNAQTQVEAFYAAFGFCRTGDVFEEAGIAHVRMELDL